MYGARKFVQASYDRNDEWGKGVLVQWLESFSNRFEIVTKDKEDYKVDVLTYDTKNKKQRQRLQMQRHLLLSKN